MTRHYENPLIYVQYWHGLVQFLHEYTPEHLLRDLLAPLLLQTPQGTTTLTDTLGELEYMLSTQEYQNRVQAPVLLHLKSNEEFFTVRDPNTKQHVQLTRYVPQNLPMRCSQQHLWKEPVTSISKQQTSTIMIESNVVASTSDLYVEMLSLKPLPR